MTVLAVLAVTLALELALACAWYWGR